VSDSASPKRPAAPAVTADSIVERAAEPVLADLGSRHPAAAGVLQRALGDGVLGGHLTAKALAAIASDLLASLPAPASDDHAD
jgi:hypothetical protein